MGAVALETCRVTLQQINICLLLHLVGFLLKLNYDARNRELKIVEQYFCYNAQNVMVWVTDIQLTFLK